MAAIGEGREDFPFDIDGAVIKVNDLAPVSYTHLDVYKRQPKRRGSGALRPPAVPRPVPGRSRPTPGTARIWSRPAVWWSASAAGASKPAGARKKDRYEFSYWSFGASRPVSRVLSFKTAIYLDAPLPARSSRLPGTVGPTCVSQMCIRDSPSSASRGRGCGIGGESDGAVPMNRGLASLGLAPTANHGHFWDTAGGANPSPTRWTVANPAAEDLSLIHISRRSPAPPPPDSPPGEYP